MKSAREMKVERLMERMMDPHDVATGLLIGKKEPYLFWEIFCEGCPALDGGDGCAHEVRAPLLEGCEREETWHELIGAIETMAGDIERALVGPMDEEAAS